MIWTQNYFPSGGMALSALMAALPIIFFFLALAVFRLKGHVAGSLTVLLALLVATLFYGMPADMALAAAGFGFAYGLWPIAWIIIAAVFLYKITVKTGQFDIIRASVLSVTEDPRLQRLLVGFSFGAFLEGAAGFGAPVAFGAMGIPIIVAGQVTGLDPFAIGAKAGHQLPFLSVLVPFWLVMMMDGLKGVRQTWPAVLVAGGSFAVTQYFTSNYIGPELPDITSALVSLVCLTLFLKVWQPREIFTFAGRRAPSPRQPSGFGLGRIARAWGPFLILTALVTLWSLKPFKALFAKGGALEHWVLKFHVPYLDHLVIKTAPIVAADKPYEALYKLDLLSAVGTAIFVAALLSIVLLRFRPAQAAAAFGETLAELKRPILSIGMVLAFAFVANYSGMSSTLALCLANTGKAFPFFSPFLGWLGVFLTGSDTSSNALFSALQASTAHQLGVSDILLVAANTTGGVTGKMISPQSIAVACAAVGLVGKEADLFRFTLKHSLIFCSLVGAMTYAMAYF